MISKLHIHFIFFLTISSIIISCKNDSSLQLNLDGTWGQIELNGKNITSLKAAGNYLYAGTNDGLYRRELNDLEWESLGPDSAYILTFVVYSGQAIIASTQYRFNDSTAIVKTTNGGGSWEYYQNGFGGDKNDFFEYPLIPGLMMKKPGTDLIVARAFANVAVSTDRGSTWTNTFGNWDSGGAGYFLEIDKDYPEMIWAGGATALFTPLLIRSDDNGQTWVRYNSDDIYISDLIINDLAMHPANKQQIVLGTSHGFPKDISILKSGDFGENWSVRETGYAVRTLAKSPHDGRVVYATGYNQEGRMWFMASSDFGDSWEVVMKPGVEAEDFLGAIGLVVLQQGKSEVLYMATDKGIYSYAIDNPFNIQ